MSRELTSELAILRDGGERGEIAKRVTYLLDAGGTILRFWEVGSGEAIDAHPDEVLAAARDLSRPL